MYFSSAPQLCLQVPLECFPVACNRRFLVTLVDVGRELNSLQELHCKESNDISPALLVESSFRIKLP